ncbi:hypothetical protein N181_30375 [Sinorhizobium fredii USDA 205]|uniref:Uncharacterized protein n=2 Tax=Sinorhizobium TaxID=28105 RepID=I3XHB2_SINF2|nr:hypothetical protein USDA257_p05530 [Sinorhizobium fredii USDA 257]ASY60573.1 hypothetical protein SS05631_a41880 [Sinorhizobium sp. CCBAU 05631]ASY67201.1 hypothetical protein SJ05684_a38870 [Sinorhizobium sojae CCBAU 05684]ASY73607.1 hypothetical protein SF83666_a40190 [Sinorhizobium fredii CCBAU 83666]AWI61906.1 hypothetical protein AB395_00004381 [Sinorhizobium fredii CCBAU 45436]AWM29828.1 hypothetical protein AOX55_00004392 [Sinorhizobium fredii CCBAU 25509]KSV91980.1 hypothetical pr
MFLLQTVDENQDRAVAANSDTVLHAPLPLVDPAAHGRLHADGALMRMARA